jgi:mannose-6-phosphate isomerase-like protein (cupin superfamily)
MVPQFIGDQFEVIYHYFCARNDTGDLRHPDQDRCIRVLSGRLFITFGGGQPVELHSGGMFTVEKGTAYRLSSAGTDDAELLFIQGSKYDEAVEHLTPIGSQNIVQSSVREDPPSKPQRRTPSKAMKHAEKVAKVQADRQEAKRQPMKKREPLTNSSVVSGSNPQPVGPNGYSE